MQTSARTRELAAEAAALREQGMRLADIATELRISLPYVSDLLRDPTGERRRERRRQPRPAPASPGELDADEMAWVISVWLSFPVSRKAVMAAARRRAISSRRGPNGVPLFRGDVVLDEIEAGRWFPHRSRRGEGWVTARCANLRCTGGESGGRAERTIRRSHHERLVNPWTCSGACEVAVGGKRRPNRSPERRQCGCIVNGEPCSNWIAITKRQERDGTGAQMCKACAEAGRKTEAQRESARASLDGNRNTEAARAHRAALAAKSGKRNGRSPGRMDKLIEARMRRHGKPYTDEMRRRVRGRSLSRAQRTSGRSLERRELERRMREMWAAGETVARIADELSTSESNVKEMRRRLGLPRRPAGRRPPE